MYLERLEIQGFKSFANPTELVFNRDLTAIVGPNGSGKSNIADAVRWVLGEQSSKTLRGKKAEDVIFSGSSKKGRLGFAQVDIYLNNKDKQAEVDYEQIVITRKIDRQGESEYLINNNKVRLFDIQLLLAKANFGQKTYSVIGQGMIDSILVASAAERKEFFDEATGVKQFQIKKNQAINKLENTKKNLEQSNQILGELAPRVRSLTRQVNRLDRREKIAAELHETQTAYYSFLSHNLGQELEVARKDFAKIQNEVSDLNQQLIEVQTKLEKEEQSSSRQENFELLQNKLKQLQSEHHSLLKEKTILEGRADLKLMSAGRADLVWLKKRIEDLTNKINKNKVVLGEKEPALRVAQQELEGLEKKRASIVKEFADLEKRLLSKDKEDVSQEEISQKLSVILKEQQVFQETLEKLDSLDNLSNLKSLSRKITEGLNNLWQRFGATKVVDKKDWSQEFNKLLLHKDNLVAEINEARTRVALEEHSIKQLQSDNKSYREELAKLEMDRQALSGQATEKNDSQEQLDNLNQKIEGKTKQIVDLEEEIRGFNKQEEGKKKILVEAQRSFRGLQANFNSQNNKLNEVKVILARLETRQEDLQAEIKEEFPGFVFKKTGSVDVDKARQQIANLKSQMGLIGGIDESVVSEYKEVSERYQFLKEQTTDLTKALGHLETIIKDLDEAIAEQFDESFHNINRIFNDYFKKLFQGGKAELILDIKTSQEEPAEEAEDDEEEEKPTVKLIKQYGIEIKATPPGKKLSSINMLSGGEKALTSIALVCAIIANNPSPFVVLDEVDAALDEANSIRFSEILNELSSKTQFIAITHNRATMHRAKIIYGVTMGDEGVSKLLSMSFAEADEIAA